jgi:hypothetical protein
MPNPKVYVCEGGGKNPVVIGGEEERDGRGRRGWRWWIWGYRTFPGHTGDVAEQFRRWGWEGTGRKERKVVGGEPAGFDVNRRELGEDSTRNRELLSEGNVECQIRRCTCVREAGKPRLQSEEERDGRGRRE